MRLLFLLCLSLFVGGLAGSANASQKRNAVGRAKFIPAMKEFGRFLAKNPKEAKLYREKLAGWRANRAYWRSFTAANGGPKENARSGAAVAAYEARTAVAESAADRHLLSWETLAKWRDAGLVYDP
jgi:hypothetical protein